MIKLIAGEFTVDKTAVDGEGKRMISGVAVPYNVFATVSDGTQIMFLPGSLPVDGKAPRLFMYHDATQPVGVVTERVDTPDGMLFAARISKTQLGDDALEMAADGTIDQVSVGVNPTDFEYEDDDEERMIVRAAVWLELSLVSLGAFGDQANITDVAASIPQIDQTVSHTEPVPKEEKTMTTDNTVAVEATIATPALPAQPKRKFDMPTAGEYMAAMHIGGETFRNVSAAAREYMISKQSAYTAAAGDVLTTDTPGLLPVPVLGPVFEDLNYNRPVVTAVGARAMPDGGNQKTFIRPTWTTHTAIGTQSNELSSVTAVTPVIAANVVSKTTLAGQVTLSVQDIDFTSPASLQIILQDLVSQYLFESDNFAADQIVAQGGASGLTWTPVVGDPTNLINTLYDVAESQLSETNFLPDHLFVSPDVWRKLSSQLDADKRPIFPYAAGAALMGVNALGQQNITQTNIMNPFGLNLIVDRNFAAGTMVLARGAAIEFYEQVRGIITVEVPGTLGRNFSYYGYVATFIADPTMVSKITVA